MSQTTPFIEYANIGDVKVTAKYDLESYKQGKSDGAREFADKLIDKCKENYENKDLALECKKCMIWRREEILEALAEWQKGKENE